MQVLAGAITVGFLFFLIEKQRTVSFIGGEMKLPTVHKADRKPAAGAALFGIGWRIAGFCPGPGLVGLGMRQPKARVLVIAMLIRIRMVLKSLTC
jgi:uncharacterized membrane protein YedE/YeeE